MNFSKKLNIDLGWPIIREINRWIIIPLFNFFEKFIPNYGIVIILLVFVIRLIISPLTYKSQIQMAKTKVLQPEMAKIKEQFPDDMQKQQSETMKLYQKVGVNPLSGCIPLLLQMPILFAMFQFIPNAIELRHKSFLWAEDLSTYDSILSLPFSIPGYGDHVSLFTLLMTLSTLLITQMSSSQMAANTPGPMKSMQYIMPFIFLFVLNGYPAGLTYYYFISNLVSYGQMKLIRRFVDDEKIKEILEKNKARNANKKKSKFQQRLEEAMKAQEETKKSKKKR
jgi:YidC/Oxa1 family membrane protein insertase